MYVDFREERFNFIRAKYVEKRYVEKRCENDHEKLCYLEDAINTGNLTLLLQVFAENVDLTAPLPSSVIKTLHIHFILLNNYYFRRTSKKPLYTEQYSKKQAKHYQ